MTTKCDHEEMELLFGDSNNRQVGESLHLQVGKCRDHKGVIMRLRGVGYGYIVCEVHKTEATYKSVAVLTCSKETDYI